MLALLTSLPSGAQTRCLYDVLSPPHQPRDFQSAIDLTGSGSVICPPARCDGGECVEEPCIGARAVTFPDGFGSMPGAGARLDEVCLPPPTYIRPVIPDVAPTCAGERCYPVTKVGVGGSVSCSVFSVPTLPAQYNPSTSSCAVAGTYTSLAGQSVYKPGGNSINKHIAVGATICPGTPSPESTNPTGVPEVYLAGLPLGTGLNQWQNIGVLDGTTCKVNSPCELFSSSSTPLSFMSGRAWYGFFDATFTPASNTTSPGTTPSYQFGAATGSAGYVANVLRGTITQPAATPCRPTDRYLAGNALSGFGVSNALGRLDTSALSRGTNANESPGRAGADFTCSAEFPCDVTLASDIVLAPMWIPGPTIFNPAGPPAVPNATQRFAPGGALSLPFTLRVTNPTTHTSCPAIGVTTTTPALADVAWTTSAPTGCGANQAQCAFSTPTTGVVMPPAGTCPTPFSKFNASAVANCGFNGKPYGGPTSFADDQSGNPYRAVVRVPEMVSCTVGAILVSNISSGIIPGYATASTNIPASAVGAAPNQASLTFAGETASAETAMGVDETRPPSGYPQTPIASTNRGSTTRPGGTVVIGSPSDPTGGCPGAAGSLVQSADATLCAGITPCTLVVVGPVVVANVCGASAAGPCFSCEYQPRQYTWERLMKDCTYAATRSEFTVDRTAVTCLYQRAQWSTEVLVPSLRTCTYDIGARRYDFAQPATTWCPYFAVQRTIASAGTTYRYQYLTKGTELIGRATTTALPDGLCAGPWANGTALESACPETVPGCQTLVPLTAALGTVDLSRATCRLKWGGPESDGVDDFQASFTTPGRSDGRAAGFVDAGLAFQAVSVEHKSCETAPPAVSPETYKTTDGGVRGFCSQSAAPPMDGGLGDGGVADAGLVDAGLVDAGAPLPDAGPIDGGELVVDAGLIDAGTLSPDAGPVGPDKGEYAVGCSCGHAGLAGGWLGAVVLLARRRRRRAAQ
ncbi:MAG: hypothetical protein Q8L14_42590 [Myxococcales bacterium]|nr:hypothetical protein [Myxococcales bacterium]